MTLSPGRRRDLLLVRQLQMLPMWRELVMRTRRGDAVARTANWAMTQGLRPWSSLTWRTYLHALQRTIGKSPWKAPPRHSEVTRIAEKVDDRVAKIEPSLVEPPFLQAVGRKAWNDAQAAARDLTAERLYRWAFVMQAGRIERMVEMEMNLNLPLPITDKAVDVLRAIIDGMQKARVGDAFIVAKGGGIWPQQGAYAPHVGQTPAEDDEFAAKFKSLSDVDRNLFREATRRTIELVEARDSRLESEPGGHVGGVSGPPAVGDGPLIDGDDADG